MAITRLLLMLNYTFQNMCYENKSQYFASFVVALIVLLIMSLNACQSSTPKDELADYTPAYFDSVFTVYLSSDKVATGNKQFKQHDSLAKDLSNVYNYKNLKWQTEKRLEYSPFVQELINACESANMHGFSAEDYPVEQLKTLFNELYIEEKKLSEEDIKAGKQMPIETVIAKKIDLDILATQTALAFMHDVYFGRMPLPKQWDYPQKQKDLSVLLSDTSQQISFQKIITSLAPKHPGYFELAGELQKYTDWKKENKLPKIASSGYGKGKKSKAITDLANRLSMSNDLEEPYDGEAVFDDNMIAAIKSFQQRNGLDVTGEIDTKTVTKMNEPIAETIDVIRLNLERYRWLPEDMTNGKTDNYIFVNIPEYMVRCYRNDAVEFESITVVGETITPTPVFQDELEFMVFSPVWIIPASIAREEIFQYALINPAVLIAGDTEVYYKGSKVDPYSVNWKQAMNDKRSYTFRQKPTSQNSMGDVKFKFPNKHGVYLHDTPAKADFKLNYRAKSSGCVRVGRPAELAEYLLQPKKEEKWSIDRIEKSMKSGRERRVNMEEDVKVHIYYFTAWVDADGQFHTAKDIYKHDKRQLPKLKEVYGG